MGLLAGFQPEAVPALLPIYANVSGYMTERKINALNFVGLNQGQNICYAPAVIPGPGAPSLIDIEMPAMRRSTVQKIAPRASRPGLGGAGGLLSITVLSYRVPSGYNFQVDGYAFDIYNTLNPSPDPLPFDEEVLFSWHLYVNGKDILNNGMTDFVGRPVRNGSYVPVGITSEEHVIANPGNLVEVIVTPLVSPIATTMKVYATVFGTLRGEG